MPRLAKPLAVLGLVATCGVQANQVTPVEKVTSLLQNLQTVLEKEGKEEAAAYDKYACFCKEQADDKLYAIESSTEKLADLDGKILKLKNAIIDLDGEIQELGNEINRLTGEMDSAKKKRETAHEAFLVAQADAGAAISAVERAIQALDSSKKELRGNAETEALAQVRALPGLPTEVLMQLGKPGEAYSYKYRSNDIIDTLKGLRKSFVKRKESLEQEEFDANSAHELKYQGLSNERKFANKDKTEKEELRSAKDEEKSSTEDDRQQEQLDKDADQNYLDVVTEDCQTKAQLWDQRSTTRSGEITAISEAIDTLNKGVAPNYAANKKLVGLQVASKGHWEFVPDNSAPSFVQTQSHASRGTSDARLQAAVKAEEVLASAAKSLKSSILSVAALKVGSSAQAPDHFVKVRGVIKDLMERLEADATAEETQKGFCDREMSKATIQRDDQQSKVEDAKAKIANKEAERAKLLREIAELSKAIAQNKKALKETTDLRDSERAENKKTLEEAADGETSVSDAISVLEKFYGTAFIQKSSYVPPNSDREGLTMGDRAPEIFDSEYHGNQDASTGIIGILEVILSDFSRTKMQVKSDDDAAERVFQEFKKTNEDDTTKKGEAIDTKDGQVTDANDALVNLKSDRDDADKSHKNALAELAKLHPICIQAEETYAERVAKRNKEIEALKEAHNILENWQ